MSNDDQISEKNNDSRRDVRGIYANPGVHQELNRRLPFLAEVVVFVSVVGAACDEIGVVMVAE